MARGGYALSGSWIRHCLDVDISLLSVAISHCAVCKCSLLCAAFQIGHITSPSIRPSVSLLWVFNSKTKGDRQNRTGVDVLRGRSNPCANFQFRRSVLEKPRFME